MNFLKAVWTVEDCLRGGFQHPSSHRKPRQSDGCSSPSVNVKGFINAVLISSLNLWQPVNTMYIIIFGLLAIQGKTLSMVKPSVIRQ